MANPVHSEAMTESNNLEPYKEAYDMEMYIKIVSILLAALFILASSIKVFAWQKLIFEKQLEFFISYGLNRKIMASVGIVEMSGALTVYFQDSYAGVYGAAAIFFTSLGAIFFHLKFDTWKDGIPAMCTLFLSGSLLFFNQPLIMSLMN